MALINNLYVHVIEENVTSGVESTTHPVEKGLDITCLLYTSTAERYYFIVIQKMDMLCRQPHL